MEARTDAQVIAASLQSPGVFGELFDRHATTMFRYFVRRVGPHQAESLLGELFRVAFERRSTFDRDRRDARPWLYGIAGNLLARHRREEARRLDATARLLTRTTAAGDAMADADDRLEASQRWHQVAEALAGLPAGEREALLLFAWEEMSYDEVAAALDIPVGTVRSRLSRARHRIRELIGASGEEEETVTRTLRPDRVLRVDQGDPTVFKREKERIMSDVDAPSPQKMEAWRAPAMYPRLAYRDEVAALEFLTRAFQFRERREARMGEPGDDEGVLAWLEFGDGVVMIGRATEAARDIHRLHSPSGSGHATVMINVAVVDIDAHYARAREEGAVITMEIEDAFYGFRRYEADDLEGHHWHFHESLADIEARQGVSG